MIKKIFAIFLFVIGYNIESFSQESQDLFVKKFNNFEQVSTNLTQKVFNHSFENPAILSMYDDDFLIFSPSYNFNNGNYKRLYDPQSENLFSTNFTGLKNLFDDGIFLGSAGYYISKKKNLYSSVRANPYSGDAFNINDFTYGDFNYNGPKVKFTYGLQIEDVLFGASVDYSISSGLKSVYSSSENTLRDLNGKLGFFYFLNKNYKIGLAAGLRNNQENIEARDINLQNIELFNFLGDTYYLLKTKQIVEETIRHKEYYIIPEIMIENDVINISLLDKYEYGKRYVYDKYTDVFEYEEGRAYEKSNELKLLGSTKRSNDNYFFGLTYLYNRIWSVNSPVNRILWDINVQQLNMTLGYNIKLDNNLLVFEYNYGKVYADSNKYIDNKFNSFEVNSQSIKAGINYQVTHQVSVSLALSYNYVDKSPINLKKSHIYGFELGFDFPIMDNIYLEGVMDYSTKKQLTLNRNCLNSVLSVKYFN